MTSKRNQCFVYIWLPGETAAITAGKFELTVDRRGTPLGRFVYGKSYLARKDAVPIDPVELKLAPRVYEPPPSTACSARCAIPAPTTGDGR